MPSLTGLVEIHAEFDSIVGSTFFCKFVSLWRWLYNISEQHNVLDLIIWMALSNGRLAY